MSGDKRTSRREHLSSREQTVPRTCKTCRWWVDKPQPLVDHERPGDQFRECGNINKIGEAYRSEAGEREVLDAMRYSYHEGGTFWTGPDFGCVHHEEKE